MKAYVREDYENNKFFKAAENVYKMFIKAENIIVANMPLMMFAVYACIFRTELAGSEYDCSG